MLEEYGIKLKIPVYWNSFSNIIIIEANNLMVIIDSNDNSETNGELDYYISD